MLEENDVLLRPLAETDKSRLAVLANNKKVWDNLRDIMPHPYTEKDAEEFIRITQHVNHRLTFAIDHSGELAGVAGLTPQPDVYRLTAEIGYWIGEPYWGKGIATTVVKLLTSYGFEQLKFIRIYAGVFEYNAASMRVLEKNGYQKEGIFKRSVLKNGKIWDEHRYAITK